MSRIISVHSFRGGTGKSNTSANLGALMAQQGLRVGVVDTDIQSPGIHVLFGLDQSEIEHSLNDYLWGKCDIEQAAHDVTGNLRGDIGGKVFLIPSSIKAGEIARIIREGYDVGLLNDGFQRLVSELQLDVLLIDTHPGVGEIARIIREGYDVGLLNDGFQRLVSELRLDVLLIDTHPGVGEETLLSIAISDALVILMRPDHQDYQGTGVTVEIGRKLGVPRMLLLVNKCPASFSSEDVKQQVEATFKCDVVAVVPHSDEMMTLASQGVFATEYPDSPITRQFRQVVEELLR